MRTTSILVLGFALALAAATLSIADLFSQLDRLLPGDVIRVETLLRGEIHALYLMPLVWQNVQDALLSPSSTVFGKLAAFLPMLLITAVVAAVCWRRPYTNWTAAGLVCLLGACLPWLLGVVMLGRIEGPQEAGRPLLLMIGAVFWGSVVCAAGAGWQLLRRERDEVAMAPGVLP